MPAGSPMPTPDSEAEPRLTRLRNAFRRAEEAERLAQQALNTLYEQEDELRDAVESAKASLRVQNLPEVIKKARHDLQDIQQDEVDLHQLRADLEHAVQVAKTRSADARRSWEKAQKEVEGLRDNVARSERAVRDLRQQILASERQLERQRDQYDIARQELEQHRTRLRELTGE